MNSPDSYPVQSYICDLLSFVLQCTSFSPLCICSHQWTETLLRLAQCSKTMLLPEHFRCKLLILRLLRQILPYLKSSKCGDRKKVCISKNFFFLLICLTSYYYYSAVSYK